MKVKVTVKKVCGTISIIFLAEVGPNHQSHDEAVMSAVPQNPHTHNFKLAEPASYSLVAPVSGSTISFETSS